MSVGIESINAYGAQTFIDVRTLFEARGLDMERFNNLMMLQKSVNLPCEDPVTNAVNAAKPILDSLTETERNAIELVITSTESGLDFGKSLSTYIHHYLGLNRRCRLFEVKQACYGGTAALQMAANFIASNASPGAKALVIATDVARAATKMTYMEPSQGVASIAMLISNTPDILALDFGANGYHGYEVMDTCRPEPEIETGDADLSLMSYLDCLEASYKAYSDKVEGVNFQETFDYLAFHTPFAGMVKGAHRNLMRKLTSSAGEIIQADFEKRVTPSLQHCMKVGNVYSGTVYLALCSLIDHAEINGPKRVGIYSYGSGCSSEFYSGIVTPLSKQKLAAMRIGDALTHRHALTMTEYDKLIDLNMEWVFGVKDKEMDRSEFIHIYDKQLTHKNFLTLKKVKNYHRQYEWS